MRLQKFAFFVLLLWMSDLSVASSKSMDVMDFLKDPPKTAHGKAEKGKTTEEEGDKRSRPLDDTPQEDTIRLTDDSKSIRFGKDEIEVIVKVNGEPSLVKKGGADSGTPLSRGDFEKLKQIVEKEGELGGHNNLLASIGGSEKYFQLLKFYEDQDAKKEKEDKEREKAEANRKKARERKEKENAEIVEKARSEEATAKATATVQSG